MLVARYATYKAVQKQPGGQQLVAFTRILHRTKPDILYNEVALCFTKHLSNRAEGHHHLR